jgi:hypothetical protein
MKHLDTMVVAVADIELIPVHVHADAAGLIELKLRLSIDPIADNPDHVYLF